MDIETIANDQLIKLGLKVQYYRKLNNLTQAELSEKASVGVSAISRLENANRFTNSEVLTVLKIAAALEISPHKFFDFREND